VCRVSVSAPNSGTNFRVHWVFVESYPRGRVRRNGRQLVFLLPGPHEMINNYSIAQDSGLTVLDFSGLDRGGDLG
jgi:hypothetical protein